MSMPKQVERGISCLILAIIIANHFRLLSYSIKCERNAGLGVCDQTFGSPPYCSSSVISRFRRVRMGRTRLTCCVDKPRHVCLHRYWPHGAALECFVLVSIYCWLLVLIGADSNMSLFLLVLLWNTQRLCCVYSADPAWLPGCTKACSTHAAVSRVLTAHLHIQNAVQYSVNCSTNYVLTTQNQHSVIHLTKMECDLWYCVYMYMFEIKHASQNGQCHVDNST